MKHSNEMDQIEKMGKWDQRHCRLAEYISKWSKDPNAQVGAVLFSKPGGDVTIGYNGFPMGAKDTAERLNNKALKLDMIVHAEENALLAAGARAFGATLYVWGKPICCRCAGSIIQAGVKRVIAESPFLGDPKSRWTQSGIIAVDMFTESDVEMLFYSIQNKELVIKRPNPNRRLRVSKK